VKGRQESERRKGLTQWSSAAAALVTVFAASGCLGGGSEPSTESQASAKSSVCGYLYEWTSAWRFPLQPDPQAAYSYVVPRVTNEPVAFRISGPFPYAAWTSWTVYNGKLQPFSVAEDSAIKPDRGSENPFVAGTPVLAKDRAFSLLVLPRGTDTKTVAKSLQDIPAANRIISPSSGKFFIIANRVYDAFPGYNRGGAAGPTKTPFPQVEAINYETGKGVDCSQHNLLPSPEPPTEMPTTALVKSPSPAAIKLTSRASVPIGSLRSEGSASQGPGGAQFAPELDPDRIELTRPPLLPGADVSSIPPPDNCAGYLGAAMSTTKIGLIRMPHVAEWFKTGNLTPKTRFEQEETAFISFTQYGNRVSFYDPGSPKTGSLGNGELGVDATGGTTIVVWPRSLQAGERKQVFAQADRLGWVVLRGGGQGPVTTANLLVRLKGASQSYGGRYEPSSHEKGVPCYFDDHPGAKRWSGVTGDKYVASARNIGPGAPQGVNCTVPQFLDGSCLTSLKTYIAQTGGSYTAR
jgi:hypothetical protein